MIIGTKREVATANRIAWVLVLAAGISVARAQEAKPAAASSKADDPPGKTYVYKQSGGQPRQMEIFFPKDHNPPAKKVPGIILFHGGNWTDGSLAGYRGVCRYFASRGIVAATADYRMLLPYGPEKEKEKDPATGMTRKQVCVRDGKSAIRWFKQHADELGVDPGRIIVGGGSAGGHIAVLASTTPDLDDPTDAPGIDTSVAAYVLWCPACTEADANDPPIDARRHVGKNFAPAVVFFGTEDSWLKHWKNLTKYSIRPRGGAEPVLWYAQGVDHSGLERDWRLATLAAADQFLVERGLLTGACTLTPPDGQKLVKAAGAELTPVQSTPAAAEPKPAEPKRAEPKPAEPKPAAGVQSSPVAPVFEENFNSYKDGEHPSSIVELHEKQFDYGETIGGRYAINNGNRHMLLAPRVKDFDLTFTAEPHPRALHAPQLIIEFRTNPQGSRGYRLLHWMGTENRLDLIAWDQTTSPPLSRRVAQPKVPPIALPVAAPIRFRLSVRDRTVVFTRNDQVLLEFANTTENAQVAAPGNIVFSTYPQTWVPEDVAPIYFDDIRLETPERGETGRVVFNKRYDVPEGLRAVSVQTYHQLQIAEVADTGLDAVQTDAPGGRVYRVTSGVVFPVLEGYKARATAARTPYLRIERPDGSVAMEQWIFNGILGNMRPGLPGGGAAQLLRLMTSYETPPRYGLALHTQAAADATGPQSSVRYLTGLPDDFNVVVGWEYFMDNDHLEASGPVEAIYRKDGTMLYAGMPLRVGDRALLLGSPLSKGLVARVATTNSGYKGFVERFKENHYFLEGEPVRFTVSLAAGPKTSALAEFHWRLLDAYRRPVAGGEGRGTFGAAATDLAKALRGSGRELVSAELPLAVKAPGVYWLDLDAGDVQLKRAFSIVPAEKRSGNTAARASGLPWIGGQFYPYMACAKDAGHYVSESAARSADWLEAVAAFNMKIVGFPPGVKIPDAKLALSAGYRIWTSGSFSEKTVQAFLASPEYHARPEDAPLRDPKATAEERQRIIRQSHFKEWIDYWCPVKTANDAAQRTLWNQHVPGLEYSSYGPPLINTFYYGNLYGARYYGWDARLMANSLRLIDVFTMETYPHDFGRQPASYTPSIALTKMGFPTVGCGWEMYGAQGYVIDSRTADGRAPNGLGYPSRNFNAHQAAEQSLGPWYFDGKAFHPAGHTHIKPQTGPWTHEMLLGMVDGLRAAADVTNLVPVRAPAFVSSWAAADLDPSWQRGSPNNAAAEAPAYAYLQSRLAGLAGGYFLDIADIGKLDWKRADVLVLPPMRGATPEQVAAIRKQYEAGMALVCFDDATGLEDIFGVRKLNEGVNIRGVQRAADDALLTGVETSVLTERVAHEGKVRYELDGATEVLSATDDTNRRLAPMLTVHRPAGRPGAVFFAAGATDVGRRRHSPDDLNLEGEVLSQLVQQALRRALLAVADPVARVSAPGTTLAFSRPDGSLYVVVMESSWPFSSGKPVEVELTLRGSGAEKARLECGHALREGISGRDERRVTLTLQPDEVVGLTVHGMK